MTALADPPNLPDDVREALRAFRAGEMGPSKPFPAEWRALMPESLRDKVAFDDEAPVTHIAVSLDELSPEDLARSSAAVANALADRSGFRPYSEYRAERMARLAAGDFAEVDAEAQDPNRKTIPWADFWAAVEKEDQ